MKYSSEQEVLQTADENCILEMMKHDTVAFFYDACVCVSVTVSPIPVAHEKEDISSLQCYNLVKAISLLPPLLNSIFLTARFSIHSSFSNSASVTGRSVAAQHND